MPPKKKPQKRKTPLEPAVLAKKKKTAPMAEKEDSHKLKAFPKLIESSLKNNTPVYANRRGITPNNSTDKPVITPSELKLNRKLGLSYKQIGKKLGIDSHKEEVLQVYKSLGIDIETVKAPAKVIPPTPLWYLFESERENRIVSRLGDNAGYMLDTYMKVATIINQEILTSYEGAGATSAIGSMKKWGGDIGSDIIKRVACIQKSVGQAAFCLSDYFELEEVGHCMCSAIKSLRFGWKTTPIPHPSFFWGCSRYNPIESGRHDKATPAHLSLWKVIANDIKVARISDKDLKILEEKTSLTLAFWQDEKEPEEDLFKHALSYYGGPPEISQLTSSKHVIAILNELMKDLQYLVQQRVGIASTNSPLVIDE